MLTGLLFLCLARWSHQTLLARGSLYSTPIRGWIPIAVFGDRENYTYAFHPSNIEAPVGAMLRFYYTNVEGSMYLWKGSSPCIFHKGIDASIPAASLSPNGKTFTDVQVNGSMTQYLALNKTFAGRGCSKMIFTLKPIPTRTSVAQSTYAHSVKACQNHHRTSANGFLPTSIPQTLPGVVTATSLTGTTSTQVGGFAATSTTSDLSHLTNQSSTRQVGALVCLAFVNALIVAFA